MKNKKNKKNVVFKITAVALLIYAAFSVVSYSYSIIKLKTEYRSLENVKKQLLHDEGNLENEIKKLSDKDYIGRYAKENYLYSKDGEYILKFNEEIKTEKETSEGFTVVKFYAIVGGSMLALAVIFKIILKK